MVYTDSNGCMVKGWLNLNNGWYYLGTDGRIVTGEQRINGDNYCFDSSGKDDFFFLDEMENIMDLMGN